MRSLFCVNSRGAREIYPSLDQINKVRRKKSKIFSGQNRKFKRFFRPKAGDIFRPKTGDIHKKKKVFSETASNFPAGFGNSSGFSGQKQVISKKTKKRSSSQKRHKIWCQTTKNTNLDLDLRSRSPEPVNFFGAQSSRGDGHNFRLGAQSVSWGGTAPV